MLAAIPGAVLGDGGIGNGLWQRGGMKLPQGPPTEFRDLEAIGVDTPLRELMHYNRFQLVVTCACAHEGLVKLWEPYPFGLTARQVIERGRCGKCGQRAVISVLLEHAGWRHQPVAWRLLWYDGQEVREPQRLRGTAAQLEAAARDEEYRRRRVAEGFAPA